MTSNSGEALPPEKARSVDIGQVMELHRAFDAIEEEIDGCLELSRSYNFKLDEIPTASVNFLSDMEGFLKRSNGKMYLLVFYWAISKVSERTDIPLRHVPVALERIIRGFHLSTIPGVEFYYIRDVLTRMIHVQARLKQSNERCIVEVSSLE
jgi:hypothetical protein